MKWKGVLIAMLAGIGMTLSSCSNDDMKNGGDGDIDGAGETAYFSFKLSTHPGTIPSGSRTPGKPEGDPAEGIVKKAVITLYDVDKRNAKYQFVLDDIDNSNGDFTGDDLSQETGAVNSGSTFTMAAKKIVKKEYLMLAVLNPSQKIIDNTKVGLNYSSFETAQENQTVNMYGTKGAGDVYSLITMSNSKGLVKVTEDMFHETAEEAETADPNAGEMPVVAVDRILSKVMLGRAENMVVDKGTFGAATWAMDITNKSTYWSRVQTNIAPSEGGGIEGTTTAREFLYAKDYNWDGVSQLRKGNPFTELAGFNYIQPTDVLGNTLSATEGQYSREYVLENTMAAEEQWEDVTSRVLIKGNYIPNGFNADDSYYFFGGAAFSHKQIFDMVKGDEEWPESPTGLQAAVESSDFDFSVNVEPGASKEDANGLISFYKKGLSYYTILVRHFDDNLSPDNMGYGRYGIVRNNVYNVSINKVTGPGKPSIPDPEGPDDKEEEYISAQVEVLPWVVRTQGADL